MTGAKDSESKERTGSNGDTSSKPAASKPIITLTKSVVASSVNGYEKTDDPKVPQPPVITLAKNLTAPPQAPSGWSNNEDIEKLRKEVDALKWLAKRKELEWDKILSLLKLKERSLVQMERRQTIADTVGQELIDRVNTTVPVSSTPMPPPPQSVISQPVTATSMPVISQPPALSTGIPPMRIVRAPVIRAVPTNHILRPLVRQPAGAGTTVVRPLTLRPSTPTVTLRPTVVGQMPVVHGNPLQILRTSGVPQTVTKAVPIVTAGPIKTVPSTIVVTPSTSQVVSKAGDGSIERTGGSSKKPLILTRTAPGTSTILRFNPASGAGPTVVTTKSLACEYCKSKPGNFKCAKCNKIRYCSATCQTSHWPSHAPKCGKSIVKVEPTST